MNKMDIESVIKKWLHLPFDVETNEENKTNMYSEITIL